MHQSPNRPHVTLAIYQHLDLTSCERQLKSFASRRNPLQVVFQHLGIFPTPQAAVFLSPIVTGALIDLHNELHELLLTSGSEPNPYYLPGNWIPHCSLALKLDPELIVPVVEIGLQIPLPLKSEITEIGVIEFRPVKHLFSFRLEKELGTE